MTRETNYTRRTRTAPAKRIEFRYRDEETVSMGKSLGILGKPARCPPPPPPSPPPLAHARTDRLLEDGRG